MNHKQSNRTSINPKLKQKNNNNNDREPLCHFNMYIKIPKRRSKLKPNRIKRHKARERDRDSTFFSRPVAED